jgi:hypothetical protein
VPVGRVSRLVLERLVANFFAETEQAAFCTQNNVPGIDFSNDLLLQGHNFSYLDTWLAALRGVPAGPDRRQSTRGARQAQPGPVPRQASSFLAT